MAVSLVPKARVCALPHLFGGQGPPSTMPSGAWKKSGHDGPADGWLPPGLDGLPHGPLP